MRARRGELNPEQAEAWAQAKGQPPFASRPDPEVFNPLLEPYWTLAMAAAWIIWRTRNAVRDYWNDYGRECREWRVHQASFADGRRELGHIVEQRCCVSLFDVLRETARQDPSDAVLQATEAVKELWGHLQTGRLESTGIPRNPSGGLPIPPYEWIDFSYYDWHGGDPDSVAKSTDSEARYNSVRVARERVMTIWPRLPSPAELEYKQRIAERSALAWLEPFWTVWHVLSWIAFRDRDRLCRIEGRSDLNQVAWYQQEGLKEQNPHEALHAALRNGSVNALGPDGIEIPSARWAFVEKIWKQACVFRRDDVCWLSGVIPRSYSGAPLRPVEGFRAVQTVAGYADEGITAIARPRKRASFRQKP